MALAVGIVGIAIGAFSLFYVLVQVPHIYAQKTRPASPVPIYQSVVAAVSGDQYAGYAGYDNFTIPGRAGNFAGVVVSIVVSGQCGGSVVCEVWFGPTGLRSFSYGQLIFLDTTTQTSFTANLVMPTGTTEIVVTNFPSSGYYGVSPFKVTVSIVDEGLVTFH
ncbi:MAG: hypothetical protein L3K14_10195 [Thermoplasmata archaeon]|nr:hypothetical protein [Thermoplasmata archaeon]